MLGENGTEVSVIEFSDHNMCLFIAIYTVHFDKKKLY